MVERIPIAGYLKLGEQDHLEGQRCDACGAVFLDRRVACGRCGKTEFTAARLGDTGTLRSFTIVHRGARGVPVPFVSAVVDLDGGGVVRANLVEVAPDPAAITPGMAVQMRTYVVDTDDDGNEAVAFGYAPV